MLSGSGVGRALAGLLGRLSKPRADVVLIGLLVVVLLLGGGLAFARSIPSTQAEEISREQPVAALAWIGAHDPGDRAFNRFEWGGYLGLHRPDHPIYIDGRADVYGDQVIAEYVRTIGLSLDPQTTFDRYRIDFVLFPPGTPLAGWLDGSPKWQRAYSDPVAAVWVRAS